MDNEQLEALERLAELKQQGVLTDAEVEAEKRRILSTSSGTEDLDPTTDSIRKATAGGVPEPRATSPDRRALALIAAVAAAIVLFFVVVRDDSEGPTTTSAPTVPLQQVVPTTTSAPATTRDGDQEIFTMIDRIVFTSGRYDHDPEDDVPDGEIFSMNADGTDVAQLTNSSADDWDPSWSPDRKHITFVSGRGGWENIFVMDADGTDVRQITRNARYNFSPSWSPDGKHIAFTSTRNGGSTGEIFVMNPDGSNVVQLTPDDYFNIGRLGASPLTWSPDSKHIAVGVAASGGGNIWRVNADGTGTRRLTADSHDNYHPAWSPDGDRIAFVSNRSRAKDSDGRLRCCSQIFLMNADGSDVVQLTNFGVDVSRPAWSPDGKHIAFSEWDNDYDIYVMNGEIRNLTNEQGGFDADWG